MFGQQINLLRRFPNNSFRAIDFVVAVHDIALVTIFSRQEVFVIFILGDIALIFHSRRKKKELAWRQLMSSEFFLFRRAPGNSILNFISIRDQYVLCQRKYCFCTLASLQSSSQAQYRLQKAFPIFSASSVYIDTNNLKYSRDKTNKINVLCLRG